MREYGLFEELAKSRTQKNTFRVMSVMVSDVAETDKMNKAKVLVNDGYIILSECHNNDTFNNATVVTIAGRFTENGIKLIEQNGIESTFL